MKHRDPRHDHHHRHAPRSTAARAIAASAIAATAAAALVVAPVSTGVVNADDPGVDCAEWDASLFDVWVDRLNPYMVRVNATYDDSAEPFDVCPYTVSYQLYDGDGALAWSAGTNASYIAADTESIVGVNRHLLPYEGCDWEVHVSIEESLPIVLDSTDVCLADFGFTIEPRHPIEPVRPVAPHQLYSHVVLR